VKTYQRSDHGKTKGDSLILFLEADQPDVVKSGSHAPSAAATMRERSRKAEAAKAAAATLEAAARDGVPFCEECEKARRKRAGR
jgi:hypothetical protein